MGLVVPVSMALVALATGCGSSRAHPSDILKKSALVQILQDAQAAGQASGDSLVAGEIDMCTRSWLDSGLFADYDWATDHSTDPSYAPANLVGTWSAQDCSEVATSDSIPDGTPCAVTINWTSEGDGRITQQNVGAVTHGSGDVSFIVGFGTDQAALVQDNHASGAGCDQDVVNLMWIGTSGRCADLPAARDTWTFDAVLSSTCPSPTWVCSHSCMVAQ